MLPGHRKRVVRRHSPGDLHELTFSTYRRLPLLTNNVWQRWLAEAIDVAGAKQNCDLVAFVFMPEHVHLLMLPIEPSDGVISRYLSTLKRPVSVKVKECLTQASSPLLQRLTVRERPGKSAFRFWQEGGGYDRNLDRSTTILSAINYIHENPVRRGICDRASDWKWSSARWYVSDGATVDPDLPRLAGLPPECFM